MKIKLVGSGTSQGIPIIGCKCETCLSDNPKDNRLRASAYVEVDGIKILIDTSIDFRQQMLRAGITDLDVILFTHHHVDHIFGNYFFRGAGTVIAHEEVYNDFMRVTPTINPYLYAKEAVPTDDPQGSSIFPDEETYFKNPNKLTITFRGNVTLRVGRHTFELISTPGHSKGLRSRSTSRRRGWFLREIPFFIIAKHGFTRRTQTSGLSPLSFWTHWMWILSFRAMAPFAPKNIFPFRAPFCGNG